MVPAVTELMVAELLYLEKQGNQLPIEMLINSSGTTRQDGEILAFDSEGIALTSTMGFVKNPISTVNMGLAVGWSAVVLSFGKKGWRKSLPHSLAMIQQPRIPPTGQRQAIEVHIKWREVLDYKRDLLRLLSIGTGWNVEKLDSDMQRPLYMRPVDALEYGLIDEVIKPDQAKQRRAIDYWVRSGRAESEDRMEQWSEYLQAQEDRQMMEQAKKVRVQEFRRSSRDVRKGLLSRSSAVKKSIEQIRSKLPPEAMVSEDEIRLPFSATGLKAAVLNAERYGDRNVERHIKSGAVTIPEDWQARLDQLPDEPVPEIDYDGLYKALEALDVDAVEKLDLDELYAKYTR